MPHTYQVWSGGNTLLCTTTSYLKAEARARRHDRTQPASGATIYVDGVMMPGAARELLWRRLLDNQGRWTREPTPAEVDAAMLAMLDSAP